MSIQVTVSGSTRPTTCPLCRGDLPVDRAQVCEGCGTGYHRACLRDLGGCGTIGCARRGEAPPALEPRVAARSGAGSGYVAAVGVALMTFVGLVGLTRVGAHLHPPRRAASPTVPPRRTPPAPARPVESHPRAPARPAPVVPEEPPPPIGTVDRHGARLDAVTRALESVGSDLQLLGVCARVEERGEGDTWLRGIIEGRLAHLDADPVAEARLRVEEARAAGASEAELEAVLRADERLLALITGTGPSPFSRAAFEPRLRATLVVMDRWIAREEAARAYADALEGSIARDQVVATLERLLADPEVVFEPAEWRERFTGPDPHEVARQARRRFVATGGPERPDLHHYDRTAELRVGKLLEKARGVLAADDAAPTPTQRVLAAIEARASQPRPR